MTLSEHLRRTNQRVTDFAAKLRKAGIEISDVSVGRYCNGRRIPGPEIMEAIRKTSGDAVQLRDWIGVKKAA